MGLDMYLHYNVRYNPDGIGKENKQLRNTFEDHAIGENSPIAAKNIFGKMPADEDGFLDQSLSLVEKTNVLYWRKANAIHQWFVENVQDGDDDCQTYEVYEEQLEQLKNICTELLVYPGEAESLLPTTEGFFFGDTEYDEVYMDDIEHTAYKLQEILNVHAEIKEAIYKLNGDRPYGPYGAWFEYRSSW